MIPEHSDPVSEIGELVTTIPPSPMPPRFFEGKKEKQPDISESTGLLAVILRANRLSSILDYPHPPFGASSRIVSISAHWPNKWTGIKAWSDL